MQLGSQAQAVLSESGSTRRVVTVCVTLPRAGDKAFCAGRAIARGDDGVHNGTVGAEWEAICGRMGNSFGEPTRQENFNGLYWCEGGGSLDEILALLTGMY